MQRGGVEFRQPSQGNIFTAAGIFVREPDFMRVEGFSIRCGMLLPSPLMPCRQLDHM
jgi:hypothetical protein